MKFSNRKYNIYGMNESQKMFQESLDFIRHFLAKGQQLGTIHPLPPDALIAIFYGALVQLFNTTRSGILEETDELIAGVEECCWNAIRVQ
ncbi:hypothetical protein [Paenibacillus faecalis]|uniref:hypothetical protein n=1 Tax=Paenibacillus faecalis TaxID=2079532 RepID=UPI001F44D027|nr:hypothetical protein [Paenibacillus faecalis]